MSKQRVVILGAGFAGVRVARDLLRQKRAQDLDIVLVNDDDVHLDITKLYEVATAYLEKESTSSSEVISAGVGVELTEIFKRQPITLELAKVEEIDAAERQVTLEKGKRLSFDTLVVALGSSLATYGVSGVKEQAFNLKSLSEALRLRHHIVRQFKMSCDLSGAEREAALTFVVAGAGSAGVEAAAELVGCANKEAFKCGVEPQDVQVILVEAGNRILRTVPETTALKVQERLEHMGITVRLNEPITAVEVAAVRLKSGEVLPTKTAVWAGGLKVHPVLEASGLPVVKWGLACEPTLRVKGWPTVYAVGDAAIIEEYPEALPATVPVAYTEGALVARNIRRALRGQELLEYRYRTVGALIAIGGKSALAVLPNNKVLMGMLPWLVRELVTLRYWSWYLPWFTALRFWWRSLRLFAAND